MLEDIRRWEAVIECSTALALVRSAEVRAASLNLISRPTHASRKLRSIS